MVLSRQFQRVVIIVVLWTTPVMFNVGEKISMDKVPIRQKVHLLRSQRVIIIVVAYLILEISCAGAKTTLDKYLISLKFSIFSILFAKPQSCAFVVVGIAPSQGSALQNHTLLQVHAKNAGHLRAGLGETEIPACRWV